jgi:hypothetical protein
MTLNFDYHVRSKPLTRTTSQPSQGTPSALRVPRASDFPWSHARIDITTILHNAPQLHYSLHPTLTIRSSPSQGPCVRRPLPKSSRTVLVLKGPKGFVRNPFSPKSLLRGSRNLVLSPITTQPLPVTSGKDRLAILSQPLLKDSDWLMIGSESFREYGGNTKPTGFGLT